jgi:putative glutamine amidotransferase
MAFNENPVSLRLFEAFREACIAHAAREGVRSKTFGR